MKFGLMFFASSEEALSGDKYRLVLDSARFADANGFSSVWVPERHFTKFGSLYPNPAVPHAALAASTSRVRLLAGSVVAPLHDAVRIAEEWSMVDNLSNGRAGISFASGWNPDDFVFAPETYLKGHDDMLAHIRTVQHLWRGGPIDGRSGDGKNFNCGFIRRALSHSAFLVIMDVNKHGYVRMHLHPECNSAVATVYTVVRGCLGFRCPDASTRGRATK